MEKDLRIKRILNKLNKLQCPFVGNGKDTWFTEIMFNPGLERYHIIQWILERLEINILEKSEQQSTESKILELQDILSALGICNHADVDIIEGTAILSKQLPFWEVLIDFLISKSNLESSSFQSCDSNIGNIEINRLKEYKSSCDYISKVCESINFNQTFNTDLQLFPDYLKKEIKPILKENGPLLSTKDIKQICSEKHHLEDLNAEFHNGIYDVSLKSFEEQTLLEIPNVNTLSEFEENLSSSACNFHNAASSSFNETYNNLKLYLAELKPEEFVDIGPSFKIADEKLQSLLQLKKSANLLMSTDSDLKTLDTDISSFQIPSGYLSDNKLREYIQIISEVKEF